MHSQGLSMKAYLALFLRFKSGIVNTIFIISIFSISVSAEAGFWGGLLSGAAGGAAAGSMNNNRNCSPQPKEQSRAEKVNLVLWDMHKKGTYSEDYEFYLDYLRSTNEYKENISMADTVAWVYFDHKDYDEALKIYENEIKPWIEMAPREKQSFFKNIYDGLKKVDSCMIMCGDLVEETYLLSFNEEELKEIKGRKKK